MTAAQYNFENYMHKYMNSFVWIWFMPRQAIMQAQAHTHIYSSASVLCLTIYFEFVFHSFVCCVCANNNNDDEKQKQQKKRKEKKNQKSWMSCSGNRQPTTLQIMDFVSFAKRLNTRQANIWIYLKYTSSSIVVDRRRWCVRVFELNVASSSSCVCTLQAGSQSAWSTCNLSLRQKHSSIRALAHTHTRIREYVWV